MSISAICLEPLQKLEAVAKWVSDKESLDTFLGALGVIDYVDVLLDQVFTQRIYISHMKSGMGFWGRHKFRSLHPNVHLMSPTLKPNPAKLFEGLWFRDLGPSQNVAIKSPCFRFTTLRGCQQKVVYPDELKRHMTLLVLL